MVIEMVGVSTILAIKSRLSNLAGLKIKLDMDIILESKPVIGASLNRELKKVKN